MHLSSSSSSPSIANSEVSKGGVKRDAGSGGTIPVNGTAVYPDTPISSVPSFAAIVSSSSPSGKTNSPFSSSTKTPSSTFLRQKHPQPSSSSGPTPPLGDNSNDNKNNFINSTSFTTGNGIAINTSAQSTIASSSSAASPPSFRRNTSESDTAIDNSNDDVENDQEDSESSDVEIYLNSFDSDNSTTRMNVLSGTSMLQFFFSRPFLSHIRIILAGLHHSFRRSFLFMHCGHRSTWTTVLVCLAWSSSLFFSVLSRVRQHGRRFSLPVVWQHIHFI